MGKSSREIGLLLCNSPDVVKNEERTHEGVLKKMRFLPEIE